MSRTKTQPPAPSQTRSRGEHDVVSYDMVRVMLADQVTENPWIPLAERTTFEKFEVVRLTIVRPPIAFAVPFLADPLSDAVVAHHVQEDQYRELNPGERAALGLPLWDGWDRVSEFGAAALDPNWGRREDDWLGAYTRKPKRSDRGRKWPGPGPDGHDRDMKLKPLDPERDPRAFSLGTLFYRDCEGLPRAARTLRPWPVEYHVERREAPDAAWVRLPAPRSGPLAAWADAEEFVKTLLRVSPAEYRVDARVTLPAGYANLIGNEAV